MRMRSCVNGVGTPGGRFFFFCLISLSLSRPAPLHAQLDSSRPSKRATHAAGELYQRYCTKCHGKDGSGGTGRPSLPDIPDFTAASWQARRTDAELMASILDGKGDDMPAFARKIKEEQARALVDHIRGFAPKGKSNKEKKEKPDASDFEERFSRLQKEMDQLRRQSWELSQSARSQQRKPSESLPLKADSPARTQLGSSIATRTPANGELFQKHCAKCHGADGTGRQARDRLPKIPDFADADWQARRTDKQIKWSILNGKGEDMPPTRGKVTDRQAGDLVDYIRNFASTEAPAETEETPPEAR